MDVRVSDLIEHVESAGQAVLERLLCGVLSHPVHRDVQVSFLVLKPQTQAQ